MSTQPRHIITLKSDPEDPEVVYLCTPPDMAQTMGGFAPARYIGDRPPVPDASYVISQDRLPHFMVYAANRGITLGDYRQPRQQPSQRPAWAEHPLPECRECGQPAKRGARLSFCPNCGTPWDPIEVGPAGQGRESSAPMLTCHACQRTTPAGFTHCCECGAKLADADTPAPTWTDA
jgi:hypothetical protein